MKAVHKMMVALGAVLVFPVLMSAQECEGVVLNTKAVSLAAPRSGQIVNFSGSGGQLDPVPVLQTNITVNGLPNHAQCVLVTFSAQADPSDNYGVYQVSIDDVPMNGHGLMTEYGFPTPVVFDAVNQGTFYPVDPYRYPNGSNSRMISYRFFAKVMPGTHTIRVKVAACCSASPLGVSSSAFVRGATLIANW